MRNNIEVYCNIVGQRQVFLIGKRFRIEKYER